MSQVYTNTYQGGQESPHVGPSPQQGSLHLRLFPRQCDLGPKTTDLSQVQESSQVISSWASLGFAPSSFLIGSKGPTTQFRSCRNSLLLIISELMVHFGGTPGSNLRRDGLNITFIVISKARKVIL